MFSDVSADAGSVVEASSLLIDWTTRIPDSQHVRFFRAVDWAQTPLGPTSTWPPVLRRQLFQVFADIRAVCLYWGPDLIALYNEAFVEVAGASHPRLMGSAFAVVYPEVVLQFKPVFDRGWSGLTGFVDEMVIMTERNNFTEEMICTGQFTPIRDDELNIRGIYNSVLEVTKQKLNDRRMAMFNLLMAPEKSCNTKTIGIHVCNALGSNPKDITMALLIQAEESTLLLKTIGAIGLRHDDELWMQDVNLNTSKSDVVALLRQSQNGALTTRPTTEFRYVEWQGFPAPFKSRKIGVLALNSGSHLFGFLIVGTNPCLPEDSLHNQLLSDLARQITSLMVAITSQEDSKKRFQRLEAELEQSERQIRYLAQHAGVTMQHIRLDGIMVWANDHFYEATGYDRSPGGHYAMSFMNVIHPDSAEATAEAWRQLCEEGREVRLELKLRKTWRPPTGPEEPTTMIAIAFPYIEGGDTRLIMSCMFDVSHIKWQESYSKRTADEAILAKQKSEAFIDSISHEVRNPLSAIFQLADNIASSLKDVQAKGSDLSCAMEQLAENVDAANTILSCANHQKRIVDDVLMLSKLDFELLSIDRSPVQSRAIVNSVVKMFEADSKNAGIEITVCEDASMSEHNAHWALCDESRIKTIWINLLTNSIKFTRTESQRQVCIHYGASKVDPKSQYEQIYWAPSHGEDHNVDLPADWTEESIVYLTFSVKDTGKGMTEEETRKIFHRFSQASNRTFVKYGGSGLGLHISQKLVKKMSGDIGVMSEDGVGSNFVFYVLAKRVNAPKQGPEDESAQASSNAIELNPPVEAAIIDLSRSKVILTDGEFRRHRPKTLYILLVEDNLVNQAILQKQLQKAGCVVYVANHGQEALEVLETLDCWTANCAVPMTTDVVKGSCDGNDPRRLDFILMDWEMPVMSGLEASRAIRTLQAEGKINRHIDIIGVTANTRREQIAEAMKAGMDEICAKPFIVKDLMMKMRARQEKPARRASVAE